MTITTLLFVHKKPGITSEEFKKHYETSHVPLVTSFVASRDDLPLLYKRHYIPEGSGVDYSAVTTVTFKDAESAKKFGESIGSGDAKAKVDADTASFIDVSRLVAVPVETSDVM
jgi:uncharacterized protein (TIGR02118 family)